MSSSFERDPSHAPLPAVRSFALRLGNSLYPHMKLRISRPPNAEIYLFSVDAHDVFLLVPPESPDYQPLQELKKHNAVVASAIHAAWDEAGLPTERNYLRQRIQAAKSRAEGPT